MIERKRFLSILLAGIVLGGTLWIMLVREGVEAPTKKTDVNGAAERKARLEKILEEDRGVLSSSTASPSEIYAALVRLGPEKDAAVLTFALSNLNHADPLVRR